jgi:hypothetical protein
MSTIQFIDPSPELATYLTIRVDPQLGIQFIQFELLSSLPPPTKAKRTPKKPEVETSEVVTSEVVTSIKVKRPLKKPDVEESLAPTCYYPHEIETLTDEQLLSEFKRITGYSHLYCSHCHKTTYIEERWLYSIRKRCTKHGLSIDMWIPSSCDRQIKQNEKSNKANNVAYSLLKKHSFPPEIVERIQLARRQALHELGITTKK